MDDFKFSPKKLNPAGSLFDYAKLTDVSKNEIAKMDAAKVYTLLTEWAQEFDPEFAKLLVEQPEYATAILAIGRGGKKPRKDIATWKEAKPYMGFFYDCFPESPLFDPKFSKETVCTALQKFLDRFDIADDSGVWFEKVKANTEEMGFTSDMKAYKAEGFPISAMREYLMTVLNSNFEDWRRANPDAPVDQFKFSHKKMNPAGSLFDEAKLRDVSKNVISRMDAERVYDEVCAFAKDYDEDLYNHLTADPAYAKSILAIGRGGKKPRKDFAVWTDVKPYLDFFFDDWFQVVDAYPENFGKEDIKNALTAFLASFDPTDDMNAWFDKIKAVADSLGFASDMKAYKENPAAYKGNVADVSMFLRVAVTGKLNSPDMYAVMQILGEDRVRARIEKMLNTL